MFYMRTNNKVSTNNFFLFKWWTGISSNNFSKWETYEIWDKGIALIKVTLRTTSLQNLVGTQEVNKRD